MSYNFTGVFPPTDVGFSENEAASLYNVEFEENTIRNDTSGGYEFTRRQFTRKPRKTFKTGFIEMSAMDFAIFESFYDKYQCSRSFTWYNKATQKAHTVRMASPPTVRYVGVGPTALYNVEVTLKEV